MNNLILSLVMPILPKRLLSRTVGWFTRLRLPRPITFWINRKFAEAYQINLEEAERPLKDYRTLNRFFTRKLKSGCRPIQGDWVHPADGELTQAGPVKDGKILQVKGWEYSVAEFLGDEALAKRYEGGFFTTYYLCPTDYHRVHYPMSGHLISVRHIPGQLWPVNEWSVNKIRSLFCLNERVVLNLKTERGPMSLVMVGATNVGQIEVRGLESMRTNRWMCTSSPLVEFPEPVIVRVGEEAGVFNMGSTVVCIYSKNFSAFDGTSVPRVTRVGQEIGR